MSAQFDPAGNRRTCSTCCASVDGACINLVSGPYDPGARCNLHETVAEFDADVAAINRFRAAIGLPPVPPG